MIELWKDCKGYEGYYQVSNLGRVRSLGKIMPGPRGGWFKKGRVLKQGYSMYNRVGPGKHAYRMCVFSMNGTCKTLKVHRLVALAFVPNPHNLPEVNHIDLDPNNNNATNLEWTDRRGNIRHSFSKNTKRNNSVGESRPASVLKEHQVLEMRAKYAAGGTTFADLGREYKIDDGGVAKIIRRQAWKHL